MRDCTAPYLWIEHVTNDRKKNNELASTIFEGRCLMTSAMQVTIDKREEKEERKKFLVDNKIKINLIKFKRKYDLRERCAEDRNNGGTDHEKICQNVKQLVMTTRLENIL